MGSLTHLPVPVLGKRTYWPKVEGGDCVICAKEEPKQSGLKILHITEGLSYHPGEQTVRVYINLISKHEGDAPVRFRVIHRYNTVARLKKFRLIDPHDRRPEILSKILAERLTEVPDNPEVVIFHKRVNCFGTDPNGVEVSLAGPGRCLEQIDDQPLDSEIEEPREDVPFSSYLIPPLGARKIEPGETAICTLELEMTGHTYEKRIKDGSDISVDSYARLMRDIKTYDLPRQGNDKFKELYNTKIEPKSKSAIIPPDEYDIIIFQEELGQSVELKSGSISITPVRLPDEALSGKALLFYGEGSEFSLRFAYPAEVIAEQRRILQEASVPAE